MIETEIIKADELYNLTLFDLYKKIALKLNDFRIKIVDFNCAEPIRGRNLLRYEVTDRTNDDPHYKLDLCPDCYKKLYKFLTGKEPNECKSESDSKR